MNKKRLQLFKLLSAPQFEDEFLFIPDCLGDGSPYSDPLQDDYGRDFTICFLTDNQGSVAVFGNIREIDYIPYEILFNLNTYNQCLSLLFGICNRMDLTPPDVEWPVLYKQIRQHQLLKEYALGETSFRSIFSRLMKGQIFEGLEKLVCLFFAYYLLCFKKEIIRDSLKNWKQLKRYYQKKGLYVFVPHPRLGKLVKVFTPNAPCDPHISSLARTIGQNLPFSFGDRKDIDIDFLRTLRSHPVIED